MPFFAQPKKALVWVFLVLSSCEQPSGQPRVSPFLEEFFQLAVIPGDEGPTLFADRFEVRSLQYFQFLQQSGYSGQGAGFLLNWEKQEGIRQPKKAEELLPVVFVSKTDAQAFARWRGMRLPNNAEWERLACNRTESSFLLRPSSFSYPWGSAWVPLYANTVELGLWRRTAPGTFESGSSPFGCYDVVGNVWEWVEEESFPAMGLAKGGSFDVSRERARCEEGLQIPAEQRAQDLGFRCVADFESFLREKLKGFRPSNEEKLGLIQIASTWNVAVIPTLERLEKEPRIDSSWIRAIRAAVAKEK